MITVQSEAIWTNVFKICLCCYVEALVGHLEVEPAAYEERSGQHDFDVVHQIVIALDHQLLY